MSASRHLLTSILTALLLVATAAPARAGGVIIDGKSPPSSSGSYGKDSGTTTPSKTTPTEQQIYLLASYVFRGHGSVDTCTGQPTGGQACSATPTSSSTAPIIFELDGELYADDPSDDLGGCAATPVSGLAALAVTALLLRRRRRS